MLWVSMLVTSIWPDSRYNIYFSILFSYFSIVLDEQSSWELIFLIWRFWSFSPSSDNLISLRDEFCHCYVPHRGSLADITLSHSKVYKQREGNLPDCKHWKQNLFGPLDGTIGSILSCRNCSSVVDSYASYFVTVKLWLIKK
jgi:hypothetical protein